MEGIATIILIIVMIIYGQLYDKIFDYRVDMYDITKVDSLKMTTDLINNNLSSRQVQRNLIEGKYDKD